MVLDRYRSVLDWWLMPLARLLRRIHPDTFTWASLLVAILGGFLFALSGPDARGLWLLAGAWVCVGLNSILDLLDGKVAKLTGTASPRGDFLDHAVDRFSDTAFLLGIAFSPWSTQALGLAALAGTLLTSYMGTQAQAVGMRRNYGGILGRADRMVLLLAMPLVQIAWCATGRDAMLDLWGWSTTFLGLLMAYFAVVGTFTTVQRFVASLRGFGPDGHLR